MSKGVMVRYLVSFRLDSPPAGYFPDSEIWKKLKEAFDWEVSDLSIVRQEIELETMP